MPVKIRLKRKGRKKRPYYHIVITDSRAPRDGRFIENVGSYDPTTNPATIELNFDRALYWLQTGAQPTDTCRAILSYKGVLYKNHLLNGAKKKALTEEQADKKFNDWLKEKEAKIEAKKENIKKSTEVEAKKRFEAESKVKEAKAQEIAKKNSELAAEVEKAEAKAREEEVSAKTSETKAEQAEAPEEKKEQVETPKEEKPSEVKSEKPTVEENPVKEDNEEPKAEEKKAE